jgi:hypothetical protein
VNTTSRTRSRAAAILALSPLLVFACAGLALPVALGQPPRDVGSESRPARDVGSESRPTQDGPANSRMPVRNITLYRSGVGYFERRATVEGQEKVQLRFATEQINDILKSMVILDLGGGRIDGVSYGSKEPLQRRLASFGIDLSDSPSLYTILSRLRGAKAKFTLVDGTSVQGTILGGEPRAEATGNLQNPINIPYIDVVTETGMRAVNLTKITGVELLDAALNAELQKALSALSEHNADRSKTVEVSFSGDGARQAIIAYVHEMPVWKTSYRLILPEQPEGRKDAKEQGGQPTIQGWAIVENTTDEDWENVKLSLVAGRPVSFQMDLYEPLHVERPDVPVPMVAGARPKIYQEGGSWADKKGLQEAMARMPQAPPPPPGAAVEGRRGYAKNVAPARGGAADAPAMLLSSEAEERPLSGDDLTRYAAAAQGQAGEIGEVFQYSLQAPVSIARQRSAMLPILSAPIDGRRVSIYNRADNPEHPMRGVELKNTSGLQLMPGPLSVFDGPAYAGDAQIGHVTLGDTRLLAYAVDLDVKALPKQESTSEVRHLRIVSGLIEQTTKQISKASYAFSNKDAKRPRTILVEHPKIPTWDLVAPKKAAEETDSLYRFQVDLAPGDSGAIDVVQEHTDLQSVAVTGYDFPTLAAYVQQGKASKAVLDAVKQASDMQAAINETERRVQLLDQERGSIDQDQTRIRQNMANIAKDSELYRRYMTKLNEEETRLEAIRDVREKEQATLTKQRGELDAYIRGLNVE